MFRIFQKEECKEHYEQENYSTPFNETDNWSTNSDEPTKFKYFLRNRILEDFCFN